MTIDIKDQILTKLLEYMQRSEDFLLEQSPEVIQQIFTYKKMAYWFDFSLSLAAICLAVFVFVYCFLNPDNDKYSYRSSSSVAGMMFSAMVSIPFIAGLYSSIINLLQIYVSPKYYILQLLLNMKGN
jgi:hypothetical protein